MKQLFIFAMICMLFPCIMRAQQKIGGPPGPVNPKAILELVSTERGFLLPRMSTVERDAISSTGTMPEGLVIFNTDTKCADYWNGTRWSSLCGVGSGSTAEVASLKCTEEKYSGNNPILGSPVAGLNIAIDYVDGNGGTYPAQAIQSTGVSGLIANLAAGTLSDGDGSLTFNITGTATSTGIAKFPLTIGNTTCEFEVTVLPPAAVAGMTSCGSTLIPSNPITAGSPIPDGTTILLHYTGGNGGGYNGIFASSAGIAGMIAGTPAGTINNGDGDLELEITGTPAAGPGGTATFTVNFAGNSCQVSVPVAAGGGGISSFSNCPGTPSHTLTQGVSYTATSNVTNTLNYTGGNGGSYAAVGQPSTGISGLFASLDAGNFATGTGSLVFKITGTPNTSGTAKFSISLGGQTCVLQINVQAGVQPLPRNMTIKAGQKKWITSAYDNNYLPYAEPTAAATTDVFSPDGTVDPVIDVAGTLSTSGIGLHVPFTVTTASVSLPAYTQTVTINPALTEDGISRDVTLSWPAKTLSPGSGILTLLFKSVGGELKIKKLDLNRGIGSDREGILLAEFSVPIDAFGGKGKIQLRAMPPIPDRNMSDANHRFVYGIVTSGSGQIWLNNDLGANYTKVDHPLFNPVQQATSATDFNAYGNMFQWGRPADGHERTTWITSTTGTPMTSTNTTESGVSTNIPTDGRFIVATKTPFDWYTNGTTNNRWSGGVNDPCPVGFHVPTLAEWNTERNHWQITTGDRAYNTPLRFTFASNREGNKNGNYLFTGTRADYWTSTVDATDAKYSYRVIFGSSYILHGSQRSTAMPVRCIKNK
jgi:uncharacterized protein (TIGR02145 family)